MVSQYAWDVPFAKEPSHKWQIVVHALSPESAREDARAYLEGRKDLRVRNGFPDPMSAEMEAMAVALDGPPSFVFNLPVQSFVIGPEVEDV